MNKTKASTHWKQCDSHRLMRGVEKLGRDYGCTPVEASVNATLLCEEFRAIPGQNLKYLAATATQLNRIDRMKAETEHDEELKRDASSLYNPTNGVNLALLKRAEQIFNRRKHYVLGR